MIADSGSHADLMDGVYRRQRHVYDLTRKYYLLGRDQLIEGLDVPHRGTVLELGCGTARNLVAVARRYPVATLHGLDISAAMLETARKAVLADYVDDRVMLAQGDATAFDAATLFGRSRFDRVYLSYALSMIPEWEKALHAALGAVAPGGSLHIVDFGQQERLPRWFRSGLRAWLRSFHVEPRALLVAELAAQAERVGGTLETTALYRGYAWHAVLQRPVSRPFAAYSGCGENSAASAAAIACGL